MRRRCPECGRGFDPDDRRTFVWSRNPEGLAAVVVVLTACFWLVFLLQRLQVSGRTGVMPYFPAEAVLFLRVLMGGMAAAWLVCVWALVKSLRGFQREIREFRKR